MAKPKIQTRRTITISNVTYGRIARAASAQRVPMSTALEQAFGDLVGPDIEASAARAKAAPKRKGGPVAKLKVVTPKPVAPVVTPPTTAARYIAVARPREVRRDPSLERQYLGDATANALGFR